MSLPSTSDNESVQKKRFIAGSLSEPGTWIISAAGLLLWCAGYPLPHVDDLFFTGVAVELARSGNLSNPWISPWMESFGVTDFLAHPPVHPYALALWVRVFGLSTATLTAFHLTVQSLLEFGVYRLARVAGLTWLGSLAAATVACLFTLSFGLRPEGLALLLLLTSQFCLYRPQSCWWPFGVFLGAGAVLTNPITMTFVIPLHLLRLVVLLRKRAGAVVFLASTVAGVGLAFAGFALAVHGQVSEFCRVLLAYSKLLTPPWRLAPSFFWGQIKLGRELWSLGPIFLLIMFSAARAFVARASHERLKLLRDLWLVWMAAVLFGIFLYPTRMAQYAAYSGLMLATVSWARSRWAAAIAAAAVASVTVHDAGLLLTPIFGTYERPDSTAIRRILTQHPEKILCIDEVVARYVFDFHLPAGTRSWSHRQVAQDGARGTLAAKPPGEIWIVNEWKLERWIVDSGTHAERLRIGSHTFGSIPRVPYRVRIID